MILFFLSFRSLKPLEDCKFILSTTNSPFNRTIPQSIEWSAQERRAAEEEKRRTRNTSYEGNRSPLTRPRWTDPGSVINGHRRLHRCRLVIRTSLVTPCTARIIHANHRTQLFPLLSGLAEGGFLDLSLPRNALAAHGYFDWCTAK